MKISLNKIKSIFSHTIFIIIGLIISFIMIYIGIGIYQNFTATAEYIKINKNDAYSLIYNQQEYCEWKGIYSIYESADGNSLNQPTYENEAVSNRKLGYVKYKKSRIGADPFYQIANDENNELLFVKNVGPAGPSDGWYYIRKDFIFPTVYSSKVKEIVLKKDNKEEVINDKALIEKVTESIKNKNDLSTILTIEKYGKWSEMYFKYDDSPFLEKIGFFFNGKFFLKRY